MFLMCPKQYNNFWVPFEKQQSALEEQLVLSSSWPQATLNNCSHLTELIGGAARETQGQERAPGKP